MEKKKDVKNTLQIHSQAKVEFYAKYLKRYLRILYAAKFKRIIIYDVYCGMGIYDNGGKGSPIVAFDAIKEMFCDMKVVKTNTQIALIVNDIEQQKIELVRNYIEPLNNNFCNVKNYNLNIEEMFNLVQQDDMKTGKEASKGAFYISDYKENKVLFKVQK